MKRLVVGPAAARSLAVRSTAALLAATLLAACGNNDPLAPRTTASQQRSVPNGVSKSSGYTIAWGKDGSGSGTQAGTNSGGYTIAWGKDGGPPPSNATAAACSGGYTILWGKCE